ncbi:MAG: GNAT family N-acetyltransferase [Dehalococcoidia bacterium]
MDSKVQHDQVTDNQAKSRFEVGVGDHVASLEYFQRGSTIGLIYLFVPEQLQYKGLEEILTKYALAYARVNHLQVAPVSPYTAEYVRERREYDDVLAPQRTWARFLPMSARW